MSQKIMQDDHLLRRLAIAAQMDREAFFAEHPRWRREYGDRLLAVALAEGPGRRVSDRGRVQPLEVWSFFRHHPDGAFPNRRRRAAASDPLSRALDTPALAGRPLTLVSVSLEADRFDDPTETLRKYLLRGTAAGARRLARGTLVLLEPVALRGEVVWQAPVEAV